MRTSLIGGLLFALTLAASSGTAHRVAAAPQGPIPTVSKLSSCDTQPATFTVQIMQGPSVFSPKRLVVYGTCFAQGASITIWDYDPRVSLTGGWYLLPSDAAGRFSYTVLNAQCSHLLQVRVLDVAHNSLARGNGKVYGPCQPPPPVAHA